MKKYSKIKTISLIVLIMLILQLIPAEVHAGNTSSYNNITYEREIIRNYEYIVITGYTGRGGTVTIPETIENLRVEKIAAYAFKNNKRITSITIPSGVFEIGDSAFEGASNLASVTINGSRMGVIGNYAFRSCTKLQSINIPSTVSQIGLYSFAYCISLPSVTFNGEMLYDIMDGAFYRCKKLTSVKLPASLYKIGYAAFAECDLRSIVIPEDVTIIGDCAFEGNARLGKATFKGVAPRSFGTNVFAGTRQFFRILYYYTKTDGIVKWSTPTWGPDSYTTLPIFKVIYDAGGGGGNIPVDNKDYFAGGSVTILPGTGLVKPGFSFLGWSESKNASIPQYAPGNTTTLKNTDITLYAVWMANPIKEPFNFVGGTLEMGSKGNFYSTRINATGGDHNYSFYIPSNQQLPPGLSLSGNVISGTPTAIGEYFFTIYAMDTSRFIAIPAEFHITITVDVVILCTVTYDANGGNGIVPADRNAYVFGQSATILPGTSLTRPGYTFLGWSEAKGATVQDYAPGDELVIKYSDIKLYAVWMPTPPLKALL